MPDSQAPRGATGSVDHIRPEPFKPNGLRPFFDYRPLGLAELIGNEVDAHGIRATLTRSNSSSSTC
jgi:hypothetical protein